MATVMIAVGSVNDALTAVVDAFTANEDTPLVVAAPGVLANDTDAGGDPLLAVLVDAPAFGTLALNTNGSFTYTPSTNFNGSNSFTYRATDGRISSPPTTVTLTVQAVADAPEASADGYITDEDTPLVVAASGVLANDTDADGGTLTAVLVNGPQHAAAFTLNPAGSFTYTPAANYSGPDSFTYRASDGALLSSPVTVTITVGPVNDAPVAVADTFTANEDTPLVVAAPGVLTNDTDVDGNPLPAVLVNASARGTLALNLDGSFSYTPAADFSGADRFTYRISDGRLTSTIATVSLTVLAVPDAPVAAADVFTASEDTPLVVAAPGVLVNDTDADGGTLTAVLVVAPARGTLALNADGSFTYTPAPNYNGPDSFTYRVSDGTTTGGPVTVSLTVLAIPDAPVAAADAFSTSEDTPLVVAALGVLMNDIDVDGDALTAVLVDAPTHGTLALNADGSFTYTPDAHFNGADSFVYRASDGRIASNLATVALTVVPVDDAPVAVNDSFTTQEDLRLFVPAPGILGNDLDLDGPALTTILVNAPRNGALSLNRDGGFVYTPNLDFRGVDSFTYRAGDGPLASGPATVTITVAAIAATTVRLDPASDTGLSDGDRITRDNTPTFLGTTAPNLQVLLYSRPAGSSGQPAVVGQTTADANGNYAVTSGVLADGPSEFFVAALRPDGLSTGFFGAGTTTIDTAAPVITAAVLVPRAGQIQVTFRDDRSGLAQTTLTNASNYSFSRQRARTPRALLITGAQALPPAGPAGQQTVILAASSVRRIPGGRYLFAVIAGGVSDVARNAVDGEFAGSYPSGNGVAGGDFNSRFIVASRNPRSAGPGTGTFPIRTTSTVDGLSSSPGSSPSLTPRRRRPNA